MERMLVVIFNGEDRAYEASRALARLHEENIIEVYADAILTKNRDSAIDVINAHHADPDGTMGATAVGSLIGMLGGPVGLAVGATTGFVIGATTDFARNRVVRDFVSDVEAALEPGKAALVAQIDEEDTDPIDARMHTLGGTVFRRPVSDLWDLAYERRIAAIEDAIARAKAEYAASHAARKAALQARIDLLNEQLHQAIEREKTRREAVSKRIQHALEQLFESPGD
jgi:uncharacterized membrane protein